MSNSALAGITIIEFPAGMIMPYAGTSTPAGWLECNGAEIDVSAYPSLSAALGSTWNNAKNPLTGATYANPAAGKFRLPDLRGSFLRGSSGGANNAQGVATGLAEFQGNKTAKNGLANASVTTTSTGNRNQFDRTSGTVSADHGHNFGTGGVSANHSHGIGADGGYNLRKANDYNWNSVNNGPALLPADDTYQDVTSAPNHSHGGGTGGHSVDHSHGGTTGGINTNHTHTVTYDSTFSVSGTTAAQVITGDTETRPDAVGVRYLIKI